MLPRSSAHSTYTPWFSVARALAPDVEPSPGGRAAFLRSTPARTTTFQMATSAGVAPTACSLHGRAVLPDPSSRGCVGVRRKRPTPHPRTTWRLPYIRACTRPRQHRRHPQPDTLSCVRPDVHPRPRVHERRRPPYYIASQARLLRGSTSFCLHATCRHDQPKCLVRAAYVTQPATSSLVMITG